MKVNKRYSRINDKNRNEEIVLLQGSGCFWKKCRFCDYYLDTDSLENIIDLNNSVLDSITGQSGWLTVINSGSFFELPKKIIEKIKKILIEKKITDLTIEAHFKYKKDVETLREELKKLGITLHTRIGIETFDIDYRENFLNKGMGRPNLSEITETFDECCLLFGLPGQTLEQLIKDINIATNNFNSVYLNIYEERNRFKPDLELINEFKTKVYPEIKKIPNLNILINNTDLGVG